MYIHVVKKRKENEKNLPSLFFNIRTFTDQTYYNDYMYKMAALLLSQCFPGVGVPESEHSLSFSLFIVF